MVATNYLTAIDDYDDLTSSRHYNYIIISNCIAKHKPSSYRTINVAPTSKIYNTQNCNINKTI